MLWWRSLKVIEEKVLACIQGQIWHWAFWYLASFYFVGREAKKHEHELLCQAFFCCCLGWLFRTKLLTSGHSSSSEPFYEHILVAVSAASSILGLGFSHGSILLWNNMDPPKHTPHTVHLPGFLPGDCPTPSPDLFWKDTPILFHFWSALSSSVLAKCSVSSGISVAFKLCQPHTNTQRYYFPGREYDTILWQSCHNSAASWDPPFPQLCVSWAGKLLISEPRGLWAGGFYLYLEPRNMVFGINMQFLFIIFKSFPVVTLL